MQNNPTVPRFNTPAGTIIDWADGVVLRATGIRYAWAKRFRPPVPGLRQCCNLDY